MSDQASMNRTMQGRVISNKTHQMVTVQIERKVKHPLYGKYIKKSSNVHAHDENNECKDGDIIVVEQCRPISKLKQWRFVKLVERQG